MHPHGAFGGVFGAPGRLIAREGWRSIFAGIRVPLIIGAPMNTAYFGFYHVLKSAGMKWTDHRAPSTVIVAAGAGAELLSSSLFVPFEVVRSRLQLGINPSVATAGLVPATTNYRGIVHALSRIHQREVCDRDRALAAAVSTEFAI